jgi:hypothetical protein
MAPSNLQGLTNMLQMNAGINSLLSAQGITGAGSLLSLVFPNAENMISNPVYGKLVEQFMKSPFSMFKDFNVGGAMPSISQVLPSVFDKGNSRSK